MRCARTGAAGRRGPSLPDDCAPQPASRSRHVTNQPRKSESRTCCRGDAGRPVDATAWMAQEALYSLVAATLVAEASLPAPSWSTTLTNGLSVSLPHKEFILHAEHSFFVILNRVDQTLMKQTIMLRDGTYLSVFDAPQNASLPSPRDTALSQVTHHEFILAASNWCIQHYLGRIYYRFGFNLYVSHPSRSPTDT